MNRLFLACSLVALVAVACGGEVQQGDQGAQGDPGSPGSAGDPGAQGASGASGSAGADGSAGAQGASGDQGEVGATGDQGQTGDIACGDTLIPAAEWHTVCGTDTGACQVGQVQCRATLSDGNSGELVLSRVCYGAIAPAANSGKCNLDTDCDGTADDTTGVGDNVTLVKQSLQIEVFVSGSSTNHDFTLQAGKCRNAKKHCLLPSNDVCVSNGNGEGVLWSDFVAATHEADMGFECVGADSTVRTWECTVTDGVASVTCTGPRGL